MVGPEDSPKLQVLLPFLWWGTFNIWSAIQKGKKTRFSHSDKKKTSHLQKHPEVIGYKWNYESAQQYVSVYC